MYISVRYPCKYLLQAFVIVFVFAHDMLHFTEIKGLNIEKAS